MTATILHGDCIEQLRTLPSSCVQTCVTSPPYFGLRDYGHPGQIGLEQTPEEFVAKLVEAFREVRRVLADDGVLWVNMGDSYAMDSKWGGSTGGKHAQGLHSGSDGRRQRRATGLPDKSLIGVPWMLAFALRADGWLLRQDIVWNKPNAMPDPTRDRCTRAHEYLFMFTKQPRYYYDHEAIKEPAVSDHGSGNGFKRGARLSYQNADGSARGNAQQWAGVGGKRNRRSVWTVATKPYKGAHFAVFPPELIEPCILAGSRPGDLVLDPFGGSGTTAAVALQHGRRAVLCELNAEYLPLIDQRISAVRAALAAPARAARLPRRARPDIEQPTGDLFAALEAA